jgi:hypothetical protein
LQDIKNAIPPHGITGSALLKKFPHPKERRPEFHNLVRSVAKRNNDQKLVLK